MKISFNALLILVLGSLAVACKKDNYEEPTSLLTGRIVYQGEPIQVEYDRVPFELFQLGFGKVARVGSFTVSGLNTNTMIMPDGSYSAMVFDGEYKFVISPGQGPFIWPQTGDKADSVTINVSGNTTKDIEVTPYYMIRNSTITGSSTTVTGTFALEKIITDANAKDVEKIFLYLNKTQFVSSAFNIATTEIAGSAITDMNNISLNVTVPAISPTQNYVFARIGVKMAGVEDLIFSPVQKITF